MIGSTHIVSLDDDGTDRDHEPATPAHTHDMGGLPNPDDAMEWLEYSPPPPSQKLERLIPTLCVLALVMWTGLFVAVNISATGGLTQWLG